MRFNLFALKISLMYGVLAVLWILGMDYLLMMYEEQDIIWLQTIKGLFFVIISAGFLYSLMDYLTEDKPDSAVHLLTTLVFLLSLGAVIYYSAFVKSDLLVEQHRKQLEIANNYINKHIDKWLYNIVENSELIALFSYLEKNEVVVNTVLTNFGHKKDYENIALFNQQGDILYQTTSELEYNKEDLNYALRNKKKMFVMENDDPYLLKIYIPVIINGQPWIVFLVQNMKFALYSVLLEKHVKNIEVILMSHENEKIIFMIPPQSVGFQENRVSSLAARGVRGPVKALNYKDQETYAYISEIPVTGWFLLTQMPEHIILTRIKYIIIQLIIVFFLVSGLSWLILTKYWKYQKNNFYLQQTEKSIFIDHLKHITRYSSDSIFLVTWEDDRIIEANQKSMEVYGDNVINKKLTDFMTAKSIAAYNIAKFNEQVFEINTFSKNNETIPVKISIRILSINRENFRQVIFTDMTEKKKVEQEIKHLSHFDSLTELPNRDLFDKLVLKEIEFAKRNHNQISILFLDLDRFKNINDSLGHVIGDKLLIAAAKRLQSYLRGIDILSRRGGDEFVMALIIKQIQDSAVVAGKILKLLAKPYRIDNYELNITASIGISIYPDDSDDLETLIKHADSAMFHVKNTGKNNYHFFTQEMHVQAMERLTLENKLRRALSKNEFMVYYQPQWNTVDNCITGAEALIRWKSGNEFISPAKFISVAEETGLIVDIGEWVLETVCKQIKEFQNYGYFNRVAVNLSSVQFRRDIHKTVFRILEQTRLNPVYLELELTEGIIMKDIQHTVRILEILKKMEISIAVDDFGTGYSSLAYLKKFPIDKLKIDRSFIDDVLTNKDAREITRAVIQIARSLKLKSIAEGVENKEQAEFLKNEGCHEIQGYWFSRPLPSNDFIKLLKEKS